MNPDNTIPEIDRILVPDGVMAGVAEMGCPLVDPRLESEYERVKQKALAIRDKQDLWQEIRTWPLPDYLERISDSALFEYTREVLFHSDILGDADQFIGWARSVGVVRGVLREGFSEDKLGLMELREIAKTVLSSPKKWHLNYRMIIGKKLVGV